jgi:hypothetical protein
MLQALRRDDEMKILSGVSQSHRGDELFEIVQYFKVHMYVTSGTGLHLQISRFWLIST